MQSVIGPYLISPPEKPANTELFLNKLEGFLKKGIKTFQLRIKEASDKEILALAKEVRKVTKRYNCLFYLNDRVDLALISEADGLHIGPRDINVKDVRKIWKKYLGVSNHSIEDFYLHNGKDVDYLSVGPIHYTTSKKIPDKVVGFDFINQIKSLSDLPIVAIGGITPGDFEELKKRGVYSPAVIRSLWDHPEKANEWVEAWK